MAESEFSKRRPKINHHASVVVNRCKSVNKDGLPRLLQQQILALRDVIKCSPEFDQKHVALVSMPTGSGKTGVIACLPYYLGTIKLPQSDELRYLFDKPILVIAPNLVIRDQLKQELTVMDDSKLPFLIRMDIVPKDWHHEVLPNPLSIEKTSELRNQSHLQTAEIVIANAQKFLAADWENHLDDDLFRLVIVDEAHHHPAPTWRRIVNKFRSPDCPVFFFTATPYRTDGKDILPPEESCIVHHLPLKKAVEDGVIRRTQFQELDKSIDLDKLSLRLQKPEGYSEEEKLDIARMVSILCEVKDLLDKQHEATSSVTPNVPHMAIAITKDTIRANLLLELWKNLYPDEPAKCYHSDKAPYEQEKTMEELKNNELSLVVVVKMLLEGFDHPPISIAAITCNIKSLLKFVQFVGRAQRIYRQDGYTNELLAYIVTHKDYQQKQNYQKYQEGYLIPDQGEEDMDVD